MRLVASNVVSGCLLPHRPLFFVSPSLWRDRRPFLKEEGGNGDEAERESVDQLTTFEKARTADFLSVAEIDRNAWKHSRNGESIPDGEHVWRLWVEHALVFVARQAEEVTGAVIAFPCISGAYLCA